MRLVIAFILSSLVACNRAPRLETRTFPLQYLSASTAEGIIGPYVFLDRQGAPGTLSLTENTVTVRETPDNLDKIARVLAEYDTPTPWVRLHFQLIEADGNTPSDARIAELEAELRELFRYTGYRLVAEAVVSGAARSAVEQAVGGNLQEGLGYLLLVEIGEIRTIGDSGFVPLNVTLRSPTGGALMTRVNARAGQTIVLGNAQLRQRGGTTILAVRPEFVTQ
jgi:hypothetical protein